MLVLLYIYVYIAELNNQMVSKVEVILYLQQFDVECSSLALLCSIEMLKLVMSLIYNQGDNY